MRNRVEDLVDQMLDGSTIDWDQGDQGLEADPQLRGLQALDRVFSAFSQFGLAAKEADLADASFAFDKLRVYGRIGAGGQGEVYRAYDPILQMRVALKLFPAGDAPGWLAEARQLARLQHPHIVRIFGAAIENGRAGLWMELVDGPNLREVVESTGPMPPAEAVGIVLNLIDALSEMHAEGILHGDIKAENVLRDQDGRVVLSDLGAAHGISACPPILLGTARYMAPELLDGADRLPEHDRYALNVLLYYLLSGEFPTGDGELTAGGVIALQQRVPNLPSALCRTIDRELAISPRARHASLAHYAASLQRATSSRRLLPWSAAAGVLAALVVMMTTVGSPPAADSAPAEAPSAEVSFVADSGDGLRAVADGAQLDPNLPLLLRLQSNRPNWVYILNRDDHGRETLLFPNVDLPVANPLPAGTTWLPGAIEGLLRGWALDGTSRAEDFVVIVSPAPAPGLEQLLSSWPRLSVNGPTRGVSGLAPANAAGQGLEQWLQGEMTAANLQVWRYRFLMMESGNARSPVDVVQLALAANQECAGPFPPCQHPQ